MRKSYRYDYGLPSVFFKISVDIVHCQIDITNNYIAGFLKGIQICLTVDRCCAILSKKYLRCRYTLALADVFAQLQYHQTQNSFSYHMGEQLINLTGCAYLKPLSGGFTHSEVIYLDFPGWLFFKQSLHQWSRFGSVILWNGGNHSDFQLRILYVNIINTSI